MPFVEGIELLIKAREKEDEKILIQRWIVNYERPLDGESLTFEEFKKKIKVTSNHIEDKRTSKQILDKVWKILGGE